MYLVNERILSLITKQGKCELCLPDMFPSDSWSGVLFLSISDAGATKAHSIQPRLHAECDIPAQGPSGPFDLGISNSSYTMLWKFKIQDDLLVILTEICKVA